MLNARIGTATEILSESERAIRLLVETGDGPRRSICYPALTGGVRVGDRVLLNVTATDLKLGTGGWDFVVANLSRLEEGRRTFGEETSGHLMKMRYAPQQIALLAAEEAHPDLPSSLDRRPVVAMELHSQIAPSLVGLRLATETAGAPSPRVAYLMPDTAALPLALSETIPLLKERGWIQSVITCGQAFGGDHEAVNLGSGMLVAAGPADCDVLIAAQGPGNAGTASALGFGGLFQSEALHLAVALGGDPILTARMSERDPRPRHRGMSHHTRAILERMLLAPVTLPLPDASFPSPALSEAIAAISDDERTAFGKHPLEFAPSEALMKSLRASGLPFSSMGRGLEEDPLFFLAAAAAGWSAGMRHLNRGGE